MLTPDERLAIAHVFGEVLREARMSAGLSQIALADFAQLDPCYPSLLELGLRGPSLAVVLQVAPVLQLTAAELVRRVEQRLCVAQRLRVAQRLLTDQ